VAEVLDLMPVERQVPTVVVVVVVQPNIAVPVPFAAVELAATSSLVHALSPSQWY
jgi:hypothetical protein